MLNTKEKIIAAAVELFNDRGYHQINLADIAYAMSMSRGNLAYHFKDKNLILDAIAHQMDDEIKVEMKQKKDFPAFSNLQIEIKSYHKLQSNYHFVFGNSAVLQHDSIMTIMHEWAQNTIKGNLSAFAFAIEVGNMRTEPYPGMYYQLAINTWMCTYFWMTQKTIRQVDDTEDAEKMVWSVVIPHFTDKGINAFKKHFGTHFLDNLGNPFSNYSDDLILF